MKSNLVDISIKLKINYTKEKSTRLMAKNWDGYIFFSFLIKKQKKSRTNANFNLFLAQKSSRSATEKIVVRTIRSHPCAILINF